jgi:hypothetical protein
MPATLFSFDLSKLVHPPEEVASFVDELVKRLIEEGHYYDGPDRRAENRHVIALQVRVMPLDEELEQIGEPFIAMTKDISRKGISFIHFDSVTAPFLAVELTIPSGSSFQAAVEVLRTRPVGPYWEVAGKYVTKVYDPIKRSATKR